jgi:1,4-alpha-glucan branching enzyme
MMATAQSRNDLKELSEGRSHAPRRWLGPHPSGEGWCCRALFPSATRVSLVRTGQGAPLEMTRVCDPGIFEIDLPDSKPFPYRFRVEAAGGGTREVDDPYRFDSWLTDFDLHLLHEGTHFRAYEKLGAHALEREGVRGVEFAVWAPNARRVSVVGDFNRWDGRHHPMQRLNDGGVWELFIPGVGPGTLYKFEILDAGGAVHTKADPYAFFTEIRPQTASVVWDHAPYAWNDGAWMRQRAESNGLKQPVSVYEVHASSWRRNADEGRCWLTYRELADQLIPYVKDLGYSHIEFLPLSEHPFDASWGYQTTGYFSPTSRHGTPDDLKYFVDQAHAAGIGVILDWVPAHFPRDAHGLARFDGTHLYEHADPRQGEHKDWGTLIFNYGRHEVRTFLLSNAVFWAEQFHVDGLRVDAVASMLYLDYSRKPGEWIPNAFGGRENLEAVDFLKKFNEVIHAEYPGFLTFAEESTAWAMVSRPTYLGGLGFGLKWNMGWMHDILEYMAKDPVHRKYHHNNLTFSLIYAFNENFILPFSHDEVVHGKRSMIDKMPGDLWQKFANLRLLYAFMYAHPGKKLLFMGSEFGQWNEWNYDAELDWELLGYSFHRGLHGLVRDLNRVYRDQPALHEVDFAWPGFEWIDYHDSEQSGLSFLRRAEQPDDHVVCLFNFTPVPRTAYKVGVPQAGAYLEILNTDAACYGGSNMGNAGRVMAVAEPWDGKPASIQLVLPPLGAVFLRPEPPAAAPEPDAAGTEPSAPPRGENIGQAGDIA